MVENPIPAAEYFTFPGPDFSVPWRDLYGPYPKEAISRDRKQEIFGADVAKMQELFAKYNSTFPTNILDRLLVLKRWDYLRLHAQKLPYKDVSGFVDPDESLAFIPEAPISGGWGKYTSYEDYLRSIGVHELCHIPQPFQMWVSTDPTKDDLVKRVPFWLLTLPNIDSEQRLLRELMGAKRLNEGFTEYLMGETTQLGISTYSAEVELIESLVSETGEEPLFLSNYAPNGSDALQQVMSQKFGRKSLDRVVRLVGERYIIAKANAELKHLGREDPVYSCVFQYLRDPSDKLFGQISLASFEEMLGVRRHVLEAKRI